MILTFQQDIQWEIQVKNTRETYKVVRVYEGSLGK